jgi:cobalt/nickel transport system permease protein
MPIPSVALHIPDGFLSVPVAIAGWVLTITMIGLALYRTRDGLAERQIPLMGILAAFVFAAQMINFPVAGGTSGHLLGGTLVAILIGPWAAALVMTAVVGVQALLFQDGGLLALGFNIFNMGILSAFTGYALYTLVRRIGGGSRVAGLVGAAAGAWGGVMVAAAATSLQLAASNTAPLGVALPAMLGVHALIGIGEALITVGALAFIGQTRPDLLDGRHADTSRGSGWIAVGLLIALAVAFASPLASAHPDGLERVAEDQGFIIAARAPTYEIIPNYQAPFVQNEALATIVSGVIGVGLVAALGVVVGRTTSRRSAERSVDGGSAPKP